MVMTTTKRNALNPNVLRLAEKLFSSQGFTNVSLEEIAEVAHMSASDMMLDKDGLLWLSALGIADAFQQALEDVLAVPRPVDDRLRYAIAAHIQVIVRNLDAANVYMHEWRYLSQERRVRYLARRDKYEEGFRGIVRAGIHAGIFSPIDEKFVTLSLLSSLNWVSQWYRPDGAMTPAEISLNLSDLILNGLYRHV